jgi:peptidoglycan/xylan/chitin deacetylase (PgdA/CDA1 family)
VSTLEGLQVALTFDAEHPDRPTTAGATGRILDALAEVGVPATFFVQGRWAESDPGLVRRMAADGHLLGNHSHHHARMTFLTGAGIRRDALAAQGAIVAAAGVDPRPWFRCPFGAGARTRRVIDGLAAIGYRDVGWTVDARDWAGGSASRIESRVVVNVLAGGSEAVVLLHGWPAATPDAVPGIVRRLRAAGAMFVRVDGLGHLPAPGFDGGDA